MTVSIEAAKSLIAALGLPPRQQTPIGALTLLVLAGLKPSSSWAESKGDPIIIHDALVRMRVDWSKAYAENSRETVRRQVLHQFVQARVVDLNPLDPALPVNSPRTHYALSRDALDTIRAYGTPGFDDAVKRFQGKVGTLRDEYAKAKEARSVPVRISPGLTLQLSTGRHNSLQKQIVEVMLPKFAPACRLLYVGDTAKKGLFLDHAGFARLGLSVSDHGKLPDIVAWDEATSRLFIVEAVTSHGPVSPKREHELREIFGHAKAGLVFITAFPDVGEFARHAADLAWETEVWLATHPTHMIHFNGDRFLKPPGDSS